MEGCYMPRGSSSRSGPAPDPNALRRERDKGEWTELPSAGREGEPPGWPLDQPSARELELWPREWRRPQALMWERNGQALEVALFVRAVVEAESPRASVAARTLVRQQMDALGLSVPGLRAARWKIVDETTPKPEQKPRARRGRGASVRDRLKVVEGGGA